MYESAAKVRKVSDAEIITNADNIIKGNREFLSSRHPNRGPSDLSLDAKALLVAENAALRARLKDIIAKKDPIIAAIAEDPTKLADVIKERKNTRLWPRVLSVCLLIWALSKCGNDKGTDTDKSSSEPKTIAAICQKCLNGETSHLEYARKNEG